MRAFLSLDMDAFYCAVEQRLDPSLRDEPFIVFQKHAAVTLSYAARKLGLVKMSNVFEVKEKYPNIRLVNGEDLSKYKHAGIEILEFVKSILDTPVERLGLEEVKVEVTSLVENALKSTKHFFGSDLPEEAGLGLTIDYGPIKVECPDFFFEFQGKTIPPNKNGFGDCPPQMYLAGMLAQYVKDRMLLELGYSCSIGVAATKTLAKIVCGYNKPGGVTVLMPSEQEAFLRTLDLRKVPGFGRRTVQILDLENPTVSELFRVYDKETFCKKLKPDLWDIVTGQENVDIVPWERPHQITVEDSFLPKLHPTQSKHVLQRLVSELIAQTLEQNEERRISKFRVSAGLQNIHGGRKSRSIPIKYTENLKKLDKFLVDHAYTMLQEIHNEPIKVLNVGFCLD